VYGKYVHVVVVNQFLKDLFKKDNHMYKNLVINAFGDLVERTDYGNHKNQLNLFDNLDEELSYLDSLLTTGFN